MTNIVIMLIMRMPENGFLPGLHDIDIDIPVEYCWLNDGML